MIRSRSKADGSNSICRHCSFGFRDRAEYVLDRLHLRDDERVMPQRRAWYRMYVDGELSLVGLEGKAPQIAAAIPKT